MNTIDTITNPLAPRTRRAIAFGVLTSNPNLEQVGLAIKVIRDADAEEAQVVVDRLLAEKKVLSAALDTVLKEFTPERISALIEEITQHVSKTTTRSNR